MNPPDFIFETKPPQALVRGIPMHCRWGHELRWFERAQGGRWNHAQYQGDPTDYFDAFHRDACILARLRKRWLI